MVIKCVNGFKGLITEGKTYKVYSSSFTRYRILNDMGRFTWEYCKNFEVTDLEVADEENCELYSLYRELEIVKSEYSKRINELHSKIKHMK